MNLKGSSGNRHALWLFPVALVATLLFVPGVCAAEAAPGGALADKANELPFELREAILAPVRKRVGEILKEKNDEGINHKGANYSRRPKKIDEDTYTLSFQVNTAGVDRQEIQRYELTIKRSKGDQWEITAEEPQDLYRGSIRSHGAQLHKFDKLSFDREGMKITATNGSIAIGFEEGRPNSMAFAAADLSYDYTAPDYLDFQTLQKLLESDYEKEVKIDPTWGTLRCDPATCEMLIAEHFTGLDLRPFEESYFGELTDSLFPAGFDDRLRRKVQDFDRERRKNRKENAFSGFHLPEEKGRSRYSAFLHKSDDHSIGLAYDNWDGYEVEFWVRHNAPGVSIPPWAPVFGYYTEQTLANTDPYDLEIRDDYNSRFYHLHKVNGLISAGTAADPELVEGDLTFGLTLKQDVDLIEFQIATIRAGEDEEQRNPTMTVNSVERDGEDLTLIRTGAYSYAIIFPELLAAGTKMDLQVDYSSRVLYKVNHAYSAMARGGWLPFVRFGDMIDEFEMTIRTPSQYKPLGIGRKVWEKKESEDVLVTHWVADSPVVFPTIIFGKYYEDSPSFEAKKLDGTVIPVTVHVDEVSMGQLNIDFTNIDQVEETVTAFNAGARGIRGKQLRPIAEQAANSINLYQEISGVEYPYGELNLVNDPAPAMYGQAPSSLIYLGSLVFRGEGTMAGGGLFGGGGGGTGTAKFLKSVTAHEVGHQWWGSRVANSNRRNYWFVESLAEYFSALYLEAVYGKKDYQEQVDEWRKRILDIDQRVSVQNADTLWGGEFPGAARQAAIYNKGPYAFHILRQTFGDEKFFPFLKKFSQELSAKGEVVTRDIQRVAEEALGGVDPDGNPYKVDLEWFFDQWIRGAGVPQYAFDYKVRAAEGGNFIIEGVVKQRVVIGNRSKYHVVPDKYYRGVVPITVRAKKGQEFKKMLVVEGPETPFRLSVPQKPLEVALNAEGEILSLDVVEGGW